MTESLLVRSGLSRGRLQGMYDDRLKSFSFSFSFVVLLAFVFTGSENEKENEERERF
jgi:hypothetical protein